MNETQKEFLMQIADEIGSIFRLCGIHYDYISTVHQNWREGNETMFYDAISCHNDDSVTEMQVLKTSRSADVIREFLELYGESGERIGDV